MTAEQLDTAIRAVVDNEFLPERARAIGRQIAPDPTPLHAADRILASTRV